MAAPHAVPITLADADRTVLVGWTRRQKTAQALALRARTRGAAHAHRCPGRRGHRDDADHDE